MEAKIDGKFVEITWKEGVDRKILLITPADIVKNYHALPAFERVAEEIVIIDGKHYQQMSDEQVASFVWGTGLTPRAGDVGTEWACQKCGTTNMLNVPICQACFHPRA